MARTAKWHGSEKLQVQPALKISERADSTTTTLSYQGPYTECVAKKPRIGMAISGYRGLIEAVDVTRLPGMVGQIDVTLRQGVGEDIPAGSDANEVTHELHWEKIQKPLAAHPRYTALNAGYGAPAFGAAKSDDIWVSTEDVGGCGTTTVGMKMLDLAKMDTQAERKAELEKSTNEDQANLVKDYLKKLGKGTEGYNAFTPVITKRTSAPKRPTATGAGFLLSAGTNPGGPLIASIPNANSYRWYKDADDATKTGSKSTYERTEVWLAVDDVDADLYKGA